MYLHVQDRHARTDSETDQAQVQGLRSAPITCARGTLTAARRYYQDHVTRAEAVQT
jgi:hypothetical protein